MKILALDIGAGTVDILLFDDRKVSIENCIKLVLPSPAQIVAAKVRAVTKRKKDLFIQGDIIGGHTLASAVKKHLKTGLRVIMTDQAAYSIRNNLDEVKELGVEIAHDNFPSQFSGETLTIGEVNLLELEKFLNNFDETIFDADVIAIAVQDHGVASLHTSNRKFRIQQMKTQLQTNPHPENLAYWGHEVPSHFLRMKSAVIAVKKQLPGIQVLVMDTASAAILGSLQDPLIKSINRVLAVNFGNGHTMAAIIEKSQIIGLLEHHTRLLNPKKVEKLLMDFADGKINNTDVFEDHGHGLFFLRQPPTFRKIEKVVATGPNRNRFTKVNFPIHSAAPGGDVMMTGPVGLIEAVKAKMTKID